MLGSSLRSLAQTGREEGGDLVALLLCQTEGRRQLVRVMLVQGITRANKLRRIRRGQTVSRFLSRAVRCGQSAAAARRAADT